MKKLAKLKYSYEYFVFCDNCKTLVKKEESCKICGRFNKKRKDNYFIYINIRQQIMHTLDKHFELIWSHINQERVDGVLTDSYDGCVYQNVDSKLEDQILLPLSINVDGAKIFNSSKSSLWPIQVTQHFLPPKIRYLRDNILIAGLYCGNEKPDVSVIMSPFAEEMINLQKNGIFSWHNNSLLHFLPRVMFCVCDLPARAQMQNCKQS